MWKISGGAAFESVRVARARCAGSRSVLSGLAGALVLAGVQACAAAPGPGGAGQGEASAAQTAGFPKAADRCVMRRTISSWRPMDARRFKIFADREYIVEMMGRCSSLALTEQLEFLSRDEQVCDYRADQIRTDRETCSIGSIRTVEEVEQAEGVGRELR